MMYEGSKSINGKNDRDDTYSEVSERGGTRVIAPHSSPPLSWASEQPCGKVKVVAKRGIHASCTHSIDNCMPPAEPRLHVLVSALIDM